jgi:thiol-disulfide isomerase/thioredoxin
MTGFVVLVVVLLAATAFGLYRRRTDGRMKTVASPSKSVASSASGAVATPKVEIPVPVADDAPPGDLEDPDIPAAGDAGPHGDLGRADLGADLGERATLVQFSTAFCQPCRATRRILVEVVGMVDGVAHVEIDAESRLDLVRKLDIRRTPTVLVLDARGHIVRRATGAPRKADVIGALGEVM